MCAYVDLFQLLQTASHTTSYKVIIFHVCLVLNAQAECQINIEQFLSEYVTHYNPADTQQSYI